MAETSHALIISQAIVHNSVNGANSISDRQLLSINKRKWGAWSLGMTVFLKFSELMTAFHLAHLRPCQWKNGLVSVAKSWHDELMICLNSENLFEFVNNFNSRPLPGVGYLRLLFQLELLLSVNYWILCPACPNWKRKERIQTMHRITNSSDHAWIKKLQIQMKPQFNECLLELI